MFWFFVDKKDIIAIHLFIPVLSIMTIAPFVGDNNNDVLPLYRYAEEYIFLSILINKYKLV